MSNEKLALSVTEAAALLGISRPTVYTLIHRADFPAFKLGKRTLISRAGLAAWVEKQSAPTVEGTTAGAEGDLWGARPQSQFITAAGGRQEGRRHYAFPV